MKKTFSEELFLSSSMFLEMCDFGTNCGEFLEKNQTLNSETEEREGFEESPSLSSIVDVSNEKSEVNKLKTLQDIRENILDEDTRNNSPVKEGVKLEKIFKFEKIQSSSKTFLFSETSDNLWKESLEKVEKEINCILVVGDFENESSIMNDKLEGESFALLAKMFSALKLKETQVHFCSFIEEEVSRYTASKNLYDFISRSGTSLIITLGAAPLKFFDIKSRLTKIHGQKLDINFQEKAVKLLPIFHPEYLLINPNMKKRVWDDIKYLVNS